MQGAQQGWMYLEKDRKLSPEQRTAELWEPLAPTGARLCRSVVARGPVGAPPD